MEHNQQGSGQGRSRRGHFHRGRRPDRRGPSSQDTRQGQTPEAPAPRADQVDVEQIMRDIRARIAQRHGIDLSTPQIQELAARRLEAILDPRNVNPNLLEQLRKAAGAKPVKDVGAPVPEPPFTFEDTTLYDTHRGFLRFMRRLLNPILKLFFNPNPIVHALNTQARLNTEQARRENERDQHQAEWNALHFELVRRVVTESARLSLEVQALSLRVESLAARVDFADRRVRAMEAAPAPRHHAPRMADTASPNAPASTVPAEAATTGTSPDASASGEGRRRRRRRRGRRSGPLGDNAPGQGTMASGVGIATEDDGDEAEDEAVSAEHGNEGGELPATSSQAFAGDQQTAGTVYARSADPIAASTESPAAAVTPAPQPQADGSSEPPNTPDAET